MNEHPPPPTAQADVRERKKLEDDGSMRVCKLDGFEIQRTDHPSPGPIKLCPNCEATMNDGESCPECQHTERGDDCDCQHCSSKSDP